RIAQRIEQRRLERRVDADQIADILRDFRQARARRVSCFPRKRHDCFSFFLNPEPSIAPLFAGADTRRSIAGCAIAPAPPPAHAAAPADRAPAAPASLPPAAPRTWPLLPHALRLSRLPR